MSGEWTFPAPSEAAALSQRGVVFLGRPILIALRDAEGDWSFLHAEEGRETAHVLSVGELLRRDASLAELADLPLGWRAERTAPGEPWKRVSP